MDVAPKQNNMAPRLGATRSFHVPGIEHLGGFTVILLHFVSQNEKEQDEKQTCSPPTLILISKHTHTHTHKRPSLGLVVWLQLVGRVRGVYTQRKHGQAVHESAHTVYMHVGASAARLPMCMC